VHTARRDDSRRLGATTWFASDWAAAYQTYVGGEVSSPPPESTASGTASAVSANDRYSGD